MTLDNVQTFQFLGLALPTGESLAKMVKAGGKGDSHTKGMEMLPEAKKLVMDLYRPHNEALARLLNDDSYVAWNNE